MNIRQQRFLHGPNVWAACPVLELTLEGNDAQAEQSATALADRLRDLQGKAGTPVALTTVRQGEAGVLAIVEFVEEAVVRAALEIALKLTASSPASEPTEDDLKRLR